MKLLFTRLIIVLLIGVMACQPSSPQQHDEDYPLGSLPYDLHHPDVKYFLNDDLNEISGLSYYQPGQLACVQDEEGKVFIYDTHKKRISTRMRFGKNGDFEGVEVVGETIYTIRSDGTLFWFRPNGTKKVDAESVDTPLSKENDVEGLGYDPVRQELLILCKEAGGLPDRPTHGRTIYGFNPQTQTLSTEPRFIIYPDSLEHRLPKGTAQQAKFEFKPSGVAVHPQTGQLYVLASVGHLLVVLRADGRIDQCVRLNPRKFRQPEGICFDPEGNLYIASEGGEGGTGYILRFSYRNSR